MIFAPKPAASLGKETVPTRGSSRPRCKVGEPSGGEGGGEPSKKNGFSRKRIWSIVEFIAYIYLHESVSK